MIDQATIEAHGLTDDEYRRVLDILGREPNRTELGIFSVMWSEHCSYKSSRRHLRKLPTSGPRVIQGPGENAGAIDIGDGLAAVFKIESHNHPSFIEPYQGAATGVGGIIRDIFTMGARPIALLDSLRFGTLDQPLTRRIVEGVVAGIAGYGNSIGIPTVGGRSGSTRAIQAIRWSMCFVWVWRRRMRWSWAAPKVWGTLSTMSGQRRGATASTVPRWPPPSSTTARPRSGRTCRSVTRSWKSYCSRLAWRSCAQTRLSVSRIWALPG